VKYRTRKIGFPRALWMVGALIGPFIYSITLKTIPKSASLSSKLLAIYLAKPLIVGAILAPVAVALH
jgi:hypothetical protein